MSPESRGLLLLASRRLESAANRLCEEGTPPNKFWLLCMGVEAKRVGTGAEPSKEPVWLGADRPNRRSAFEPAYRMLLVSQHSYTT